MNNSYELFTKCEVNIAGYWPRSFFACLWTDTESSVKNTSVNKWHGMHAEAMTFKNWP